MLDLLIKYCFTITCIIYGYYKILNINKCQKIHFLFLIITELGIIFITYGHTPFIRLILLLSISFTFVIFHSKVKMHIALVAFLISLSLSYAFLCISGVISGILFILIYNTADAIPYTQTHIFSGIIQTILYSLFLKNKRINNGILSIIKNRQLYTGLFISILVMFPIIYISINNVNPLLIQIIIVFLLAVLSYSLLFYWRHRITQMYREKLRKANERSMLDEINEHKLTIEKLQADNKCLASIVHADNKLIPAMLTSVTAYLENHDNLTSDELASRGLELSEQLQHMAMNRQDIIDLHPKETSFLPKSGLHTVDGMLSFMETRAKENHITYKVTINENIKETAVSALNEEDLLRLLGDLIDNAIIASKHSDDRKAILIHMATLQNHFLLEISDSGIPFSIETYQHFGNEQYTTHGDSGGSGIGLMDIWKIKKNYKASLHIYEYPNDLGIYTKKISFLFDRKNHFLLQTNRYKEIMKELTRGDLYVFPYQLK